jgi:hypothetical protein
MWGAAVASLANALGPCDQDASIALAARLCNIDHAGSGLSDRVGHFPCRSTLGQTYFPCLTCSAGFVTPSSPVSIKIVSSAFCGPK